MLVFAAAVFGTSKILGKKMADTSEVMAQATFPLVYVDLNGKQINCMHGYAQEMDVIAMRDTLTPLSNDKTVNIQIQPFEDQQRQLRSTVCGWQQITGKYAGNDTWQTG